MKHNDDKVRWGYSVGRGRSSRSGFVIANNTWQDAVKKVEKIEYRGIRIHDLYRSADQSNIK